MEELVAELDRCHIDYFHIDCNDNPEVFKDIKRIKEISKTPVDLHIISETPEKYFDLIRETKPDLVTYQYEQLSGIVEFPKVNGVKYGLAVISDTPVEVFEEYKDQCDFILIMTTTPGQSGGKFRKDNFKRIRKFRNQFPGKGIYVDGGVNDETGFILRLLGVHSVVSGSFLVNHESLGEALMHLRSSVIHSDFLVKDFMIDESDAPVLVESNYDVKEAIKKIDEGNMGFAIIKDSLGRLSGITSNADVRKGLLKNLEDLNKISLDQIVNTNPVSINEEASITELLQLIRSKNFLISYLPVVNKENKLTGALSFINLIRSES
jgi:ribulose-phosphate 3-epimerase